MHFPAGLLLLTSSLSLTIMTDPLLFHSAQDADPQLHLVIADLTQGRKPTNCVPGLWSSFLDNDVLCRRYVSAASQESHIQIVVSSSLRDDVLRHLLDNIGHFGVKRTTDCVKTRFYWPGYEADIAQWVLQCEACQRRNPPVVTPCAPLGTLEASYPFERISWDIMGPLPTTEKGNWYIFVVTDLFTKMGGGFCPP